MARHHSRPPPPPPAPADNPHIRQLQTAIAALKEQVGTLGVPEWRALRECRRGLGALLASIEGRAQG
jgi:hypothetical protein